MALDKLVDSTQLDADLTSVANAIRTKGGTSAQLAFPADFVQAIEAIETGGGGGMTLLASGEYVKASSSTSLSIPVTYTGTPKMFYVYVPTPLDATGQTVFCAKWLDLENSEKNDYTFNDAGFWCYGIRTSANAYQMPGSTNSVIPKLTATAINCYRANSGANYQANTYKWYIYGEA